MRGGTRYDGSMTNTALLDTFYAAIKSADAPTLATCVSADFELLWQGPSALPWAGRWRGVDGLLAFFTALNAQIEVLRIERLHLLADDAVTIVVLQGHWRARKTGTEITARAANVFTLADGRIASYTVLNDSGAFVEALKIAPA